MNTANEAWFIALSDILATGDEISPRGMKTWELPQRTTVVDMRYPVVIAKTRKLNYRFMAAEAYWILSGDDRVETIAPYNRNIAQFSDDGERFFGAYGPPIRDQLNYVIEKLIADRDTRQAVMTIWRQNPPPTNDVPCTVAFSFMVRDDRLNVHCFMRSSDVWLGLPYDVFNFSMLGALVCAEVNSRVQVAELERRFPLSLGLLYLTAASAHLYERNHEEAKRVLEVEEDWSGARCKKTPTRMTVDSRFLMQHLRLLREAKSGDPLRWWEESE